MTRMEPLWSLKGFKTLVHAGKRLVLQAKRSFETLHAEGKSRREATRLLKRYLARRLYRLLENREPLLA